LSATIDSESRLSPSLSWAVRRNSQPEQLAYARRMIVKREGRAQVARSLGVDPSTLRRLLTKGE
jgi:hypothetical protein